ncbi:MAG: glycosyltransferase [Candidatus Tenebribacter burtonii]|nr:glycosyltransferase [Candidatus Tenebribacter burtonii]
MISFIIIGHNEGWKLTKCFQSVFDTIEFNLLKKCEIIYVDSNSTDDSIERAKEFNSIKIFKITGECNAAIARNIGAKESTGDSLFFIDGDMEIIPEYLQLVYDQDNGLKYNFVSGQVKNYNYNINNEFLGNSYQFKILSKDEYHSTTGGIFIVKKELWTRTKGMDINFRQGEDHDFALRLTKLGYPLLRKSEIIANHHTIDYLNEKRMWNTIFSGNIFYPNVFLLRKHLSNIYIYKGLIKFNYTTISLMLFLVISLFTNDYMWLSGYVFFLIIKVYKNRRNVFNKNFELFLYYVLRDISLICAFFFLPIKKVKSENIRYNLVK